MAGATRIERLAVRAYQVPTDAPEADGTFAWRSTTLVVVEVEAGDGTGLGYFCLFVFLSALVYSWLNFTHFQDPGFGVIWLYWAVLWGLFFVVLGLKREDLTRYTGAIALVAGLLTAAVPAFMLLTGVWDDYVGTSAVVLAVVCVASLVFLYRPLRGHPEPAVPPSAPVPGGAPASPEGVPVARRTTDTGHGAGSGSRTRG